jgi:acyl-CoA thioester hydrolase
MSAESDFRAHYAYILEASVEWGDMDAFRHVNNTVYFRYFERVRIAWFMELGWIPDEARSGIGPILASVRCRFRHALSYPDDILIGASVADLEADRFLTNYGIYSKRLQKLAAEGDGLTVSYDYGNNRKAPIPPAIYEKLAALLK